VREGSWSRNRGNGERKKKRDRSSTFLSLFSQPRKKEEGGGKKKRGKKDPALAASFRQFPANTGKAEKVARIGGGGGEKRKKKKRGVQSSGASRLTFSRLAIGAEVKKTFRKRGSAAGGRKEKEGKKDFHPLWRAVMGSCSNFRAAGGMGTRIRGREKKRKGAVGAPRYLSRMQAELGIRKERGGGREGRGKGGEAG